MLSRVEFEAASLRQGHNQASTQAATEQYTHNAEIEDHGSARVIVLNTWHASVFDFNSIWVSLNHLGTFWFDRSWGRRLRVCGYFRWLFMNHLRRNSFRSSSAWLFGLLSYIRVRFGLSENDRLLDLRLCVRIQLCKWLLNILWYVVVNNVVRVSTD